MKISQSINLTQKRNFMVFLYNISLNIKKLNFVDDVIYGEQSYRLATTIYNSVPCEPTYLFNSQQDLRNHCDDYIARLVLMTKSFYIVLDTYSVFLDINNKHVASPRLPLINTSSSDLVYWYQLLSQGHGINHLLIASTDFLTGIHTAEYADYPTQEHGGSDRSIYECFIW